MPAACKNGSSVTVSGKIDRITPSKEDGTVLFLVPAKTKEVCNYRFIHSRQTTPADCSKGSSVTAKGVVQAEFEGNGGIDLVLQRAEGVSCSGEGSIAAATQAEQDCAKDPEIDDIDRIRQIEACNEVIAKKPNDAAAYCNRGDAYKYLDGDPLNSARAITDYTQSISLTPILGPEHAPMLVLRASSYRARKKTDEARADLTKAIDLDPKLVNAYYERALLLSEDLGDYKSALADYTKLVEFQPGSADNLHRRANAYIELGDYKSALADYQKSVVIKPDSEYALAKIAKLKSLLDNADTATECAADLSFARGVKACGDIIEKNENDAEAYSHRANLYLRNRKFDAALMDYNRALALSPKETRYLELRSRAYELAEQPEAELADYNALISLQPGSVKFYEMRARFFSRQKVFEKSTADWSKAIELDKESIADYRCWRGHDYDEAGDRKRADADYKAADKLSAQKDYCHL